MNRPDIRTNKENKLIRSIVIDLYFASFMIFFTVLIGGTITRSAAIIVLDI